MSDLGYEHGRDVIVNEQKKPVLYDHKERPLVHQVGFQPREQKTESKD